jgi:hypothetical protein
MKKTFALATIVLMASSVTACGSSKDDNGSGGTSGSGSYCDTLQSVKSDIVGGTFNNLSQASFDALQSKISNIQSSAPDAVSADWQTLGDYLDQFEGLFKAAGLNLDDLQGLQAGKIPDGVDPATLTKLSSQLAKLSDTGDLSAATTAIEKSAKSDCKIDLEDTSGTPASGAPSS